MSFDATGLVEADRVQHDDPVPEGAYEATLDSVAVGMTLSDRPVLLFTFRIVEGSTVHALKKWRGRTVQGRWFVPATGEVCRVSDYNSGPCPFDQMDVLATALPEIVAYRTLDLSKAPLGATFKVKVVHKQRPGYTLVRIGEITERLTFYPEEDVTVRRFKLVMAELEE